MMLVPDDPLDRDLALRATGLLRDANLAGVVTAADVHVAERLGALGGETDDRVLLVIALAVRAVRHGSVCVDLATLDATLADSGVVLPARDVLVGLLDASPLAGSPPVLRRLDDLVYLDRYWREEEQVCDDVVRRAARPAPAVDAAVLERGLARVFRRSGSEEQQAAARRALGQWTTVLTGGPGTGKTTTVAALLALMVEQAEVAGSAPPRIALAAPTGKAAARLTEAVAAEVAGHLPASDQERLRGLEARTLHRLLGYRPGAAGRFRHDRHNRLPHDVVVVDETSMVSLTMMARLLEAVRPEARLILVGDPDQLSSVEAGAVLADLVAGLAERPGAEVAALRTSHRYGSVIGRLADAVRDGRADDVLDLLASAGEELVWVEDADSLRSVLVPHAREVVLAAQHGDPVAATAALDRHRLLCAHRSGPYGIGFWNRQVERWLAEDAGLLTRDPWYVGRPLLVAANDYGLGVYNGDTGVVIATDDGPRAQIAGRSIPTSRLGEVETMHAMTIHKSQGSQVGEVTVLMPEPESRLLTRELLYTALTRAQRRVRVVGSAEAVRAAVERPALRASGLRRRLGGRG